MNRKSYCDYLRILALFAVVVIHVAMKSFKTADVNGSEWQAVNFYDSIVRWGVPIFVMISGSLFLNRDISLKKIYSKYILRMCTAFLVWSLFYVLMKEETIRGGILYGLKANFDSLIKGHYHMWFIFMIIGIYMCIPFYKKIVSDRTVMKYFLVLSFIFSSLFPWLTKLITDFVAGNNEKVLKIVESVNTDIGSIEMHVVLGYSFYFVLGYYLDSIELQKKTRIYIYILGIAAFAFTILADLYIALRTQQAAESYYGYLNVNVALEAVCVHTLIKYHRYDNERINAFFAVLSKYSFGGYLVHAFFVDKFSSVLGFNASAFNAWFSIPLVACSVFICALVTSAVMNHVPIVKKFCV